MLGFTLEEIYTEGTKSLWTKLRWSATPTAEIAQITHTDPSLSYEDRAGRALLLLRGSVLGEGADPPSRDPEVVAAFFDSMRWAVDPRHSPPEPVTIQWDLIDTNRGSVHIDNGSTRCRERGRSERPDLTMTCRFQDVVDIATGREDPRRAIALRRVRPKGSLRLLWRTQKLFN